MDIISFNEASTANGRIESFIENPDSSSGVVTVPKVIASGETITIPSGRVAVLPNVQIDGTLNVQGDVFIPSGATLSGVVEKVTSTDNAIVRFNGTTGDVQNSGVTIDDNGNIGIGTSTPIHRMSSYKATGWNTGVGTQSGNRFIQLSADSFFGTDIFWDNTSQLRFSTGSASDATGYAERMRINTSGNVGIGTTTDNGVDKLQVNGSIKATELNVSANYITKVSKNVPGLSSSDYKDKYFILFKTPTWGAATVNYGVKGSLIAERSNNLGETVYTDFSAGCGYNNAIYKTYFQNKGNISTSLVFVTINSIQYVAIYWYSAPNQYFAWFDGFITNIGASSAIDNLCGTIYETAQNALSRTII